MKRTPEHQASLVASYKQSYRVAAQIARLADAKRGRPISESQKEKLRAVSQSGAAIQRRARLHDIRRNRPPTEAQSLAWSRAGKANLGRTHSEESRAKVGAASRERNAIAVAQLASVIANTGKKRPPAVVSKIVAGVARYYRDHPEAKRYSRISSLNHALYQMLTEQGLEYIAEQPFGSRAVDAYVPATNTVYEADGTRWHQDRIKEAIRDSELLAFAEVDRIIHIPESELREFMRVRRQHAVVYDKAVI